MKISQKPGQRQGLMLTLRQGLTLTLRQGLKPMQDLNTTENIQISVQINKIIYNITLAII